MVRLHKMWANLSGIRFPLDDVQDADITTRFTRCRGDHAVLRLQQSSHHVQHCGFADRFCLLNVVACEGRVGSHKEVAAGRWDKRGDNTDEIVMHVAGVTEGSGTGGHYRRDELVRLLERRLLYM